MLSSKKRNKSSIFLNMFFVIFSLMFIIPILCVISISISDEKIINAIGYSIIPKVINLSSYKLIFENPVSVINAYKVSIFITVVGTFLGLLFMSMCSYALSRQDFKYRNKLAFYLYFTMLFSGGLIPSYMLLVKYLHLKDTLIGLIFPSMINVFFIFMLRAFFKSIPFSIIEAAIIDGANEYYIFFNMIVPLSTPALATVGLMVILNYWNEWFIALLLITDNNLRPLQFMLQQMLLEVQQYIMELSEGRGISTIDPSKLPTEGVRMAMAVIAAGPMLFVFPFFQKYFVKGVVAGSVKG